MYVNIPKIKDVFLWSKNKMLYLQRNIRKESEIN